MKTSGSAPSDVIRVFTLVALSSFVNASLYSTAPLTTTAEPDDVASQEELLISIGVCALGIIIFILGLVALIIAFRRYHKPTPNHEGFHSIKDPFDHSRLHGTFVDEGTSGTSRRIQEADLPSAHAYRQMVHRQVVRDLRHMAELGMPLPPGFTAPRNHSAPNVYEDIDPGHPPAVFSTDEVDTTGYTAVGRNQRHVHLCDYQYSRPLHLSLPQVHDHQLYEEMGGACCCSHKGPPYTGRHLGRRDGGQSSSHNFLSGLKNKGQWDISPPSPLMYRSVMPKKEEDERCCIENCENEDTYQHLTSEVSPSGGEVVKHTNQMSSPQIINNQGPKQPKYGREKDLNVSIAPRSRIYKKQLYTPPQSLQDRGKNAGQLSVPHNTPENREVPQETQVSPDV